MAWELEIHTIDVSQGESALVIAKDANANLYKSMLIDAGLQKYGGIVDDFVANKLGNRTLDYIAVSHYDVDHSGGITQLLLSDNYSAIAYQIANAVWGEIDGKLNAGSKYLAGKVIGAFVAITGGCYNDGTTDGSVSFANTVLVALINANLSDNLQEARTEAYKYAKSDISNYSTVTGRFLMKYYGSGKPKALANGLLGLVLGNLQAADLRTLMYNYIFDQITPNNKGFFSTRIGTTANFRYANATIYDPGDTDIDGTAYPISSNDAYKKALAGSAKIAGYSSKSIAATGRTRTTPGLGNELMGWNNTAAAPHVYCLARGLGVYQNNQRVTQDNGNGISIGLGIQFGKFAFFTGGDLPADGLQMIPGAFLNRQGFGNLTIIPAFKAGHHGSAHALNQNYLDNSSPVTSVISCGYKQFGEDPNNVHPDQATIDLLHDQATILKYFLTNCKIERNHVPASLESPQIINGNKSRVSGDNGYDEGEGHDDDVEDPQAKVHRGNISLLINQAESSSNSKYGRDVLNNNGVYRQFRVGYYENDAPPNLSEDDMAVDAIGATSLTLHFWQ